jgi:excinuclease UvrABC nuclease subunit
MPFPAQTPNAFTRVGIENLSPNQTGCYGILSGSTVIYVGKGDIRSRLLDHFNGGNTCISRSQPTNYVTVLTNDPDTTEKALIIEFKPACNHKVG